MPKVYICICTGGEMPTNVVNCLLDLITHTADKAEIGVGIFTGGYKPLSLLLGVKQAKENNFNHIMFIDCDQIFPPDGLVRLLEQDKDVIGANYNERKLPLVSTVKIANKKGQLIARDASNLTKPFKCYALGFGFMLCKMSVFDRISKPYFNAPIDENDNFKTDDVYFCEKLQKAGVDIWCDPRIVVKHQGSYLY